MKKFIKKNNKWYDMKTGKQFVGIIKTKNGTFRLTEKGDKISLSKPKPDKQRMIANLWEMENSSHRGYRNGKYYPYITPNGNEDIGPGIDMSKQTNEFRNRARRGLTNAQVSMEVNQRIDKNLKEVDKELLKYTLFPDTISPQIKEGLVDLQYQVGSLKSYPKLMSAVAHGDLNAIRKESKVNYRDGKTGRMTFDVGRYNKRNDKYFHYRLGGSVRNNRFPSLLTIPGTFLVLSGYE